jgi:hypothetical protein
MKNKTEYVTSPRQLKTSTVKVDEQGFRFIPNTIPKPMRTRAAIVSAIVSPGPIFKTPYRKRQGIRMETCGAFVFFFNDQPFRDAMAGFGRELVDYCLVGVDGARRLRICRHLDSPSATL